MPMAKDANISEAIKIPMQRRLSWYDALASKRPSEDKLSSIYQQVLGVKWMGVKYMLPSSVSAGGQPTVK